MVTIVGVRFKKPVRYIISAPVNCKLQPETGALWKPPGR